MEKIWGKLKELIYKDVSRESESNDLSVLLRELALVEIIVMLLLAGLLAYLNTSFLCLCCVFTVGIMAAVLMLTFEDKTVAGMYVYIVINHVLVAIACLETEWRLYYAPMIIVCIMLFFFNARVSMKIKVYYSIGEVVFLIALLIAEYLLPLDTAIGPRASVLIIVINICGQVASASLEAYS